MEKLQVYNYSITNSGENHLDVYIDGAIVDAETQQIWRDWWGDETSVSFKSIRDQINKSGATDITFWINSYGGHVGDAMAIHDLIQDLESRPAYNIKTKGLGMICSSATYILSASQNSEISKNSWYMIHNVSGGVWGDVAVVENYAKTMRKFNDTIVNFYANLTGKEASVIEDWMKAETWFTGEEAVSNGFVQTVTGEVKFTNAISADIFPYKNKSALNLYNSFVKPAGTEDDNDENILNLNTDMNKLTKAIVDALTEAGFISNDAKKPATPLTTEGMTNALDAAFKTVDIPKMVNESVAEMFKDGVPESLQEALTPVLVNSMKAALKDVPTNEALTKIETELEAVKKDVIANANPAAPKKKEDKKEEVGNKFEHEGIVWGNPKEDE